MRLKDGSIRFRSILPSLVWFASSVLLHAILALEPFGAFNAVPLAKSRKIFCWLGVGVLGEVFRRAEIGMDLVEVSISDHMNIFSRRRCQPDMAHLVLRFVFILRTAPMVGSCVLCSYSILFLPDLCPIVLWLLRS